MKNTLFRCWQLLLGWGVVGVIYNLSDQFQGVGRTIMPSWIDNLIPFSPTAIWLYLSFFLIIPLGYILTPRHHVKWLARAMQFSGLGAGAVYLAWPTTMNYPANNGHDISAQLLKLLTSVDSTQNCLPSLHIALTVLAVWAIAKDKRTARTVFFILWGAAIAFAILQLRRHLFVDLVAGAVLAWGAGWLAQRLNGLKKSQQEPLNNE